MEKLPGVQLSVDWAKLDMAKILRLCTQLATLQNSMLSKTFKNIGAIYYADDLNATSAAPMVYTDEQGKELCDPRFVVGPVIDQTWMLNGRCKLECYRGPCEYPQVTKYERILTRLSRVFHFGLPQNHRGSRARSH